MTQVPIIAGIYSDTVGDWRSAYPRNLVPVPKQTGISSGYLRPAEGITAFAAGPGIDRGGINWRGVMYRVMGSSLVSIDAAGVVTVLGGVGGSGRVTMDYGFDRLAIWSGGRLWYYNGTSLTLVTDGDLGNVIDGKWIAGYYMSTDGTSLIVTELNNPLTVNPLKYGSAESDPDPILAVDELRNEAYAFGRYTVEVFQNVGGDLFPFRRIEGAQVGRGVIGTHAYAPYLETFAFVGSAKDEAPGVYLLGGGASAKLSTREIDETLRQYSEAQLSAILVEARVDRNHQHLLIHLPDCTLVYDHAATQAVQDPVWFTLDSGVLDAATYRARGLVWCYDKWLTGDTDAAQVGELVSDISTHYGQAVGWQFGTPVVYNGGRGAIFHELELVTLPGRVPLGAEPVVWTSYSLDGETWSVERPVSAGSQGQRDKRLVWRRQGKMGQYRMQRFRGTSDAHLSMARLEVQLEPLSV
jgi:hypothetical protein